MKKIVSFFDDVLKVIGVTYLFIVIAGFVDLKIYYSYFGISINEYLTVSELFFASFDKILLVLISIILQLILWLLLFNYLFAYDIIESQSDGEKRPTLYHDETIHRFFKSKSFKVYGAILIIGTVLSVTASLIFSTTTFLNGLRDFFLLNYWIGMCLYMMWIQATRSFWEAMKKKQISNAKPIITLIVFLTVLVMSIWIKNLILFNRVKKYGINNKIEIYLSDSTKVLTSDTTRYVGRTEGHLFYWNRIDRSATVIPATEVKKIILNPK